MLARLNKAGTALPIEIWHVNELSQAEIDRLQNTHEIARGVVVRDLSTALSDTLNDAEIAELRGFMCKPLAVLASTLDEVLQIEIRPFGCPRKGYVEPSYVVRESLHVSQPIGIRVGLVHHRHCYLLPPLDSHAPSLVKSLLATSSLATYPAVKPLFNAAAVATRP